MMSKFYEKLEERIQTLCSPEFEGRIPTRENGYLKFMKYMSKEMFEFDYEMHPLKNGHHLLFLPRGQVLSSSSSIVLTVYSKMPAGAVASERAGNAASVALLMELVRILKESRLQNELIFSIHTEPVEARISDHFLVDLPASIRHLRPGHRIKCSIVIDTVGYEFQVSGKEHSLFALPYNAGQKMKNLLKQASIQSLGTEIYLFAEMLNDQLNQYLHSMTPTVYLTGGHLSIENTEKDSFEYLKASLNKVIYALRFVECFVYLLDDIEEQPSIGFRQDHFKNEIKRFFYGVDQMPAQESMHERMRNAHQVHGDSDAYAVINRVTDTNQTSHYINKELVNRFSGKLEGIFRHEPLKNRVSSHNFFHINSILERKLTIHEFAARVFADFK